MLQRVVEVKPSAPKRGSILFDWLLTLECGHTIKHGWEHIRKNAIADQIDCPHCDGKEGEGMIREIVRWISRVKINDEPRSAMYLLKCGHYCSGPYEWDGMLYCRECERKPKQESRDG